jgi:hypothetical protein
MQHEIPASTAAHTAQYSALFPSLLFFFIGFMSEETNSMCDVSKKEDIT